MLTATAELTCFSFHRGGSLSLMSRYGSPMLMYRFSGSRFSVLGSAGASQMFLLIILVEYMVGARWVVGALVGGVGCGDEWR